MRQPIAKLLVACGLGLTWLLGASSAFAYRHYDRGGLKRAEARYERVFSLGEARPNPRITPGALNPAVDQANIRETICARGYSKSIRPPEKYTERLKRQGIRRYHHDDRRLRDYEEDHLVSLELGGSPRSPHNLWPEPHHVVGGWGSYAKDRLEDRLHWLVCRGRVPLALAQHDIATDWIAAYRRYVGHNPAPGRRRRVY
ncbi:MAG TPA: hypothetical protein VND24_00155 [Steroidobacteraceae bacterium]|nr:hypothetical protein [Steroidobacteraceae bacterium]